MSWARQLGVVHRRLVQFKRADGRRGLFTEEPIQRGTEVIVAPALSDYEPCNLQSIRSGRVILHQLHALKPALSVQVEFPMPFRIQISDDEAALAILMGIHRYRYQFTDPSNVYQLPAFTRWIGNMPESEPPLEAPSVRDGKKGKAKDGSDESRAYQSIFAAHNCLEQLCWGLADCSTDFFPAEADNSKVFECIRWGFYASKERSVKFLTPATIGEGHPPQRGLVPLMDSVNYAAQDAPNRAGERPNVVCGAAPGQSIAMVASRYIRAGEELLLPRAFYDNPIQSLTNLMPPST